MLSFYNDHWRCLSVSSLVASLFNFEHHNYQTCWRMITMHSMITPKGLSKEDAVCHCPVSLESQLLNITIA